MIIASLHAKKEKKRGRRRKRKIKRRRRKKRRKTIREIVWKGAVVRSRIWGLSVLSAQFFFKPTNSLLKVY